MEQKVIILIGDKNSKRTDYFIDAARAYDLEVDLLEWKHIFNDIESAKILLNNVSVKIDPPSYQTIKLQEMKGQIRNYVEFLHELGNTSAAFLNTPAAIHTTLDKRKTKQLLQQKNISTTKMIAEKISSIEELFDIMRKERSYSVFIKPCEYSGAAGVAAFRLNPVTRQMKLYTSCRITDQGLCNTKRLYCINDSRDIISILEYLIKLDVIVERWYAKDTIEQKSYDLRVVFQFGKIVYIVVRRADGPITNLHLNNQAEKIDTLGLDAKKLDEIESLCAKACNEIAGLQVAGVDVMLEKGSKTPRIIEINGQGDLIYQDIFDENKIYKQQIAEFFMRKKQRRNEENYAGFIKSGY